MLPLTIDDIKKYNMGKAIKTLTKEESNDIRTHAEDLMESWKQLVEKTKAEEVEKEKREKEAKEKRQKDEAEHQKLRVEQEGTVFICCQEQSGHLITFSASS